MLARNKLNNIESKVSEALINIEASQKEEKYFLTIIKEDSC